MAYSKSSQLMNFPWLIARKLDRLDMGEYSTSSQFHRLDDIYGLVRGINPKETEQEVKDQQEEAGDKFRSIADIMDGLNAVIKSLRTQDAQLRMKDKDISAIETEIEGRLGGLAYDLKEVIYRCKITDSVRAPEGAVAL